MLRATLVHAGIDPVDPVGRRIYVHALRASAATCFAQITQDMALAWAQNGGPPTAQE